MRALKKQILISLTLPREVPYYHDSYPYRSYKYLYFLLDFQPSSIRDAIGQLFVAGEVDKIVRNNRIYFRLTGAGRARLINFLPLYQQGEAWDGYWRLIIKDGLDFSNQKMIKLGFRKLVRGVYLTPMPEKAFKELSLNERGFANKARKRKDGVRGRVIFIEKCRFWAPESSRIVQKLWNLDEISQNYAYFITLCRKLLRKANSNKGLENQAKNDVSKLFNRYFNLIQADPGIPKKLLPDDWRGDLARKTFLELFTVLETKKLLDIF